jgi:hypothetical protein
MDSVSSSEAREMDNGVVIIDVSEELEHKQA